MRNPCNVLTRIPTNEEEESLIEDLGILINLNLTTCTLKLGAYEGALLQCDLPLKFDFMMLKLDLQGPDCC